MMKDEHEQSTENTGASFIEPPGHSVQKKGLSVAILSFLHDSIMSPLRTEPCGPFLHGMFLVA